MTHIVTATRMELHVSSGDDGAFNAAVFGADMYVLSGCSASVVSANEVKVAGGEILMHGRHIRVNPSGESVTIANGSQSKKRNDLIGILYTRDAANHDVEDAPLHVLKGTAVPDAPADPAYNSSASILKGDASVFRPLYRVTIDGLSVGAPVPMYKTLDNLADAFAAMKAKADKTHKHSAADIASGTLPVARGGTGVTTDKAIALKSYPVGAVYTSHVSTSPASLFGGTWTAITGRFPYYNNGTGTGGSNTHTLTANEMPSHNHSVYKRGNNGSTGAWGLQTQADYNNEWASTWVGNSGGGGSHNNMPAYQTLYAWRRTA